MYRVLIRTQSHAAEQSNFGTIIHHKPEKIFENLYFAISMVAT